MTKQQLANALANTETSVALGQQTKAYWIAQYMRCTKPVLEARWAQRLERKSQDYNRLNEMTGWAL